jgi:DNA-binding response OmpR family regulator
MSGPPTIIISEPDPGVRAVLRVEFSHVGFVVLLAADGQEAEAFAARTVAHLVVLDVGLKGFGGYDACARIRRLSGYRIIPIVLTTQRPSARVDAAAEQAVATAVLAKPYSFNDLLDTLAPHLPPDDALRVNRPNASIPGATDGHAWGQQASLAWRFGSDSGLSQNRLMLPIVRGGGVKIPLYQKP